MIDIGKYDKRVTIQTPTETRSFSGEAVMTWGDVATVWAQVDGLSSRDILQAQQANVVATYRVRIRHRSDVSHLNRLVYRGRQMELASVTSRGDGTYLEMLAREVQ